jgi:hypothetical protein
MIISLAVNKPIFLRFKLSKVFIFKLSNASLLIVSYGMKIIAYIITLYL